MMNRTMLAAVGTVVLLAAVGAGTLFVDGSQVDGAPIGGDSGATTTPASDSDGSADSGSDDGTTGDESSGDGGGPNGTTRSSDVPYRFDIVSVEKCGTTCRDVTARLANAGTDERTNVQVTTKVYAKDDLLWTGNETVGALAPGEAHTSTKRVDVGLSGAMKIQNNDGYVTIVTVARSDEGTTRFSERRKVA